MQDNVLKLAGYHTTRKLPWVILKSDDEQFTFILKKKILQLLRVKCISFCNAVALFFMVNIVLANLIFCQFDPKFRNSKALKVQFDKFTIYI